MQIAYMDDINDADSVTYRPIKQRVLIPNLRYDGMHLHLWAVVAQTFVDTGMSVVVVERTRRCDTNLSNAEARRRCEAYSTDHAAARLTYSDAMFAAGNGREFFELLNRHNAKQRGS